MDLIFNMLFHSTNPLFGSFSLPHLSLIALPLIMIGLMLKNKSYLQYDPNRKWVWWGLMGLLIGQQILLYSWYYFTDNFDIIDALPLYPCRVSSLLCILLMVRWNEKLFNLLFFMGLPGALLALLMPDTWNLGFPNALCIQFFAGHSAILMTIFYLLIKHRYEPSKQALLSAYKFCSIYLGFLFLFNIAIGSNYGYMAEKPQIGALNWMPDGPYHIPLFVGFMYFIYWVIYKLWPQNHQVINRDYAQYVVQPYTENK